MGLLFKTSSEADFKADFKDVLGYVDADIPLRKIKPDLMSATREIIKTIGQPTYDAIEANYNLAAGHADKDEDLILFARLAIASQAYALFAPANDLAHSPNGRKMRTTDEEKTPFEWMIAQSDDNLKKRSYRALDDLITYMDANFDTWKTSAAYKEVKALLLNTVEQFNKAYQIDSRLLLIKLAPGIAACETKQITSRLGKDYFKSLKQRVQYFAITDPLPAEPPHEALDDDELLLLDQIREACAYSALSWALPRFQLQLFPEGVLQAVRGDRTTIKGRVAASGMQVQEMAQLFQSDCDRVLLDIEDTVKAINPPEPTPELTEGEEQVLLYGFDDDENFVNT